MILQRPNLLFVAAIGFAVPLQAQTQTAATSPLLNAAQAKYGARISLSAGAGVKVNDSTPPQSVIDGNLHSRAVVTGAPYTFNLEFPLAIPIEKIAFAQSDYATEEAPKDIEIRLDDGTVIKKTLDASRPVKRKGVWQEVAVGKTVKSLQVAVLSNHANTNNWGGLGEMAVYTAMNLNEAFQIPNYNADAPSWIHSAPVSANTAMPIQLPPRAAKGEHPRLLMTPAELTDLRAQLKQTEKGRETLANTLKIADAILLTAPDFPDPKGPLAQIKSRGDEPAKRHDRLSLEAGNLGIAYALSGDEKYAQGAAKILRGYADLYAQYPEHKGVNKNDTGKVMGQRLSEAMWLIPLLQSYDYIHNSAALTPTDRTAIETQLVRPAVEFIRNQTTAQEAADRTAKNADWRNAMPADGDGKPRGNWLNFYNTATMMAGALLEDRDMIDLAASDFRALLKQGIGSDGMWGEGAIGYQLFAMSAMVPGFETAARQGIDLWSFDDNRFKMLFDSPLRYAYPDGSAPGINDSSRAKLGGWQTMNYDYALLRYGDQNYAPIVNNSTRQLHFSQGIYFPTHYFQTLPEPTVLSFGSTVFDNLGYAITRAPNAFALMDYGQHGGTHGHYDKLNLILFGQGENKGDELGGEPQFHGYENPLHGQWTTQTVAHNTMAVDQSSQIATTGKLLVFEDAPNVKIMRGQSDGAYAGVLLDRTVVTIDGAVVDLYHGSSALEHQWDRTLRFAGDLAAMPAATDETLGKSAGYQHLKIAARRVATSDWRGVWQTGAGPLNVNVVGAPAQQIVLAKGPDGDDVAVVRQSGKTADFAIVYRLDSWSKAPENLRLVPSGAKGVTAFEMTQDDAKTQVWVAHREGAWQAANWKSDARVLVVQTRGDETQINLSGGTFAGDGKSEVRQNVAGNYQATGKNGALKVTSSWTPPAMPVVASAPKTKRGKKN